MNTFFRTSAVDSESFPDSVAVDCDPFNLFRGTSQNLVLIDYSDQRY